MDKTLRDRFLCSASGNNRKSKIQNLKLAGIAAIVVTFVGLGGMVEAQQPTPVRIGWISSGGGSDSTAFNAFRGGLHDLGYVEERSLIIDARWGEGSNERTDQLAMDLVRSNPRVIVTQAGTAVFSIRRAGATMPIVFGFSGDPVEAGLVGSYAHPGRNLTGVSFLSLELVGKRVELLKETIPSLKRIAILANPLHPGEKSERQASQAAIKALGLVFEYFEIRPGSDFDDVLAPIAKSHSEAIVVFPDAGMLRRSEQIAAFAAKNRIPAMSGWAEFAERGNLMTYGPKLSEGYRRLAYYVDKILKGTKPSELPVELPIKLELVINLRAAKQIGLTIPDQVLYRADKVIR